MLELLVVELPHLGLQSLFFKGVGHFPGFFFSLLIGFEKSHDRPKLKQLFGEFLVAGLVLENLGLRQFLFNRMELLLKALQARPELHGLNYASVFSSSALAGTGGAATF